eukprot:8633590-Alexandrium_andersonii.AAC.1
MASTRAKFRIGPGIAQPSMSGGFGGGAGRGFGGRVDDAGGAGGVGGACCAGVCCGFGGDVFAVGETGVGSA